jgi:putative SOS response-associated peptidase YedK
VCGRFSFGVKEYVVEGRFNVEAESTLFAPRYNCAPTQKLAVISNVEPDQLSYFRWGLIPVWAKESAIGAKMINAKAETITEKPSFRQSFKKRRCLVPADSFYEWQKETIKTPYRILMQDEQAFAMAGIWDIWINDQGEEVPSFSILTTMANSLIASIHHRMPVILSRENESRWLEDNEESVLLSMLTPYPAAQMKAYKISRLVNSPTNDSPDIWLPAK